MFIYIGLMYLVCSFQSLSKYKPIGSKTGGLLYQKLTSQYFAVGRQRARFRGEARVSARKNFARGERGGAFLGKIEARIPRRGGARARDF